MSWREKKSERLAFALINAAGFVLITPVMLGIFFDLWSIGIAFIVGAVLAIPLIVLGLIFMPAFERDPEPKPFLPRRRDLIELVWNTLFYGSLIALVILIPAIFAALMFFVFPPGDDWGIVMLRFTAVSIALAAGYLLWQKLPSIMRLMFEGKVSEAMLSDLDSKPAEASVVLSPLAAAWKHWRLALITLIAFAIALGVIDLNHPAMRFDGAPRRLRGIVEIINWCRGNPNTFRSSALLVGFASAGWFGFKVRRDSRERPEADENHGGG